MRQLCTIAAALALTACAETEQVGNMAELEAARSSNVPGTPGGAASNAVAPDPAATAESGQWFERNSAEGRWAGFGPPNSEASFSVRCEGERLVFSTTEVPRSGPGPTTMTLSAAGVEQSLDAQASEEGLPNSQASVPAGASWLQQLQSASGDLTVTVAGGEPIIVPISNPLTSLIGDCGR